jgi:hypothetical protein
VLQHGSVTANERHGESFFCFKYQYGKQQFKKFKPSSWTTEASQLSTEINKTPSFSHETFPFNSVLGNYEKHGPCCRAYIRNDKLYLLLIIFQICN